MLLSFIKKLLQLLISADYQFYLLDIDFDLDEQSKTLYENFFRCPISWNAPKLGIGLASEDILTLLPGANEELAQINEKLFMERLTSNLDSNLELRIKSLLLTHLPRGQYNKGFIAGQLNMSSRTLHNKLRRHGLSFQSLLDETRSELALSYLRQQLPINEIAHRLGYTDTSNFCRAFKRYHGYSPSNSRSKDKVIAAADR